MDLKVDYSVLDRFLRYVKIDTQSDPESGSCPSTPGQKNLAKVLLRELKEIGFTAAEMDENCYIYAGIPATTKKVVPVICLCSHMDTSPDCSGKNVKPIIHSNYDGGEITLPQDPSQLLRPQDHPELKNQLGNDIITSDGTTLLGADNKAGVAAIMNVAEHLMKHKEIEHGEIRILFTPDEERGRGVDKVNMQKVGAQFGYTVDGETLGSVENETFSADEAILKISGHNIHPGFAKGKLENAIKIAAEILSGLPGDAMSPETTEGREGFLHPITVKGDSGSAEVHFIVRSFDEDGLKELEDFLNDHAAKVLAKYSRSGYEMQVKEQYRNMKTILDQYPDVLANAVEAVKRAGITPVTESIRGGTDGSRLSFMGLPCPNIFTGGHAFHSKQEWVSVQDMQKTVDVLLWLCMLWAEKA